MSSARTAADPDRAVEAITRARRVVVTGLVSADAETAVAACALAESCGAAVDPGSPETSRIVGPLVARIGAVTAAAGELADRADLVVFWFCDPTAGGAGFPTVGGRKARRTIAVGPRDATVPETEHRHLVADAGTAVDLARLLEAVIRDIAIDETACPPTTLAAARDVAAAIAAAHTVGFVTDWRHDVVGLAAWATTSLMRTIAQRKPAFEVPLGERDDAAVAVCTWRYGAAGAIARADRDGGRFLPAEEDAVRLIGRHEIDCIVVVGTATPEVEAAIERAGPDVTVVHLPADAAALRRVAESIPAVSGPVP